MRPGALLVLAVNLPRPRKSHAVPLLHDGLAAGASGIGPME
jgi:hypothetical protein